MYGPWLWIRRLNWRSSERERERERIGEKKEKLTKKNKTEPKRSEEKMQTHAILPQFMTASKKCDCGFSAGLVCLCMTLRGLKAESVIGYNAVAPGAWQLNTNFAFGLFIANIVKLMAAIVPTVWPWHSQNWNHRQDSENARECRANLLLLLISCVIFLFFNPLICLFFNEFQ